MILPVLAQELSPEDIKIKSIIFIKNSIMIMMIFLILMDSQPSIRKQRWRIRDLLFGLILRILVSILILSFPMKLKPLQMLINSQENVQLIALNSIKPFSNFSMIKIWPPLYSIFSKDCQYPRRSTIKPLESERSKHTNSQISKLSLISRTTTVISTNLI